MEALMFSAEEARELAGHFGAIVSKVPLHPIRTGAEYEEAVRVLNVVVKLCPARCWRC